MDQTKLNKRGDILRKHRIISIACIIMLLVSVNAQAASSAIVQRYSNHWANQNLQNGIAENWMEHISDDIDIDSGITKAEYLIMLEKAIELTPGSATAEILASHSTGQNPTVFVDITGHPVYTEGWLKTAADFGIVVSTEYQNRLFGPDAPISRREAIMMATRALGEQHSASSYTEGTKLFIDWDSLPQWVKGFTNELVNFDILKGYPEGTVQLDNNLTYAEAAALVDRTKQEMFQGVDENIKIVKTYSDGTPSVTATLPVPIQIINGKMFVPLRVLYGKNTEGLTNFTWDPVEQSFQYTLDVFQYTMYAGDSKYIRFNTSMLGVVPNQIQFKISQPRILSGEFMVPIETEVSQEYTVPYIMFVSWNPEQKILTIDASNPEHWTPTS